MPNAPVTLIAGGQFRPPFGTKPWLSEALAATGREKPNVVLLGAANGDSAMFQKMMSVILTKAGAGEVVWPRTVGKKRDAKKARAAIEAADAIFVNGGDVEEGMKVLAELDLVDPIRAAAKRGAVCAGLSAGAIMLGDRWIRWPREDAGDDEAETFECLGVAAVTIDTHGEKDGWNEIQSYVTVRSREKKAEVVGYGVPSNGALLVDGKKVTALGKAAQVFRASRGGPAEALADLEP